MTSSSDTGSKGTPGPVGILPAKVHRNYLHSNSTSHTWPFSAIAELIDNAYDPDVGAKRLSIDADEISGDRCLSFTDDGNGMTPQKLHQMLSFGFCDKDGGGGDDDGRRGRERILGSTRGHIPLGQYGNGFKSGSMRLGKDAFVFTKASHSVPLGAQGKRPTALDGTMSVGLLSQTMLERIKSETVLVPIVSWNATTRKLMKQPETDESLDCILRHSMMFDSEEQLFEQFDSIETETGTKIIIYNLNKGIDTVYELDFDSDEQDILLASETTTEATKDKASEGSRDKTSEGTKDDPALYRTSLKEYCSILFLTSRMSIVLRKRVVDSKRLLQNLIRTRKDSYKPRGQDAEISITFGRWDKARSLIDKDFGVLFYYKNRLIKAYEKIGCQRKNEGQGVIAILEIPPGIEEIVPIHNKQEFLISSRFSSLVKELSRKLNIYCREKSSKVTDSGCSVKQDFLMTRISKTQNKTSPRRKSSSKVKEPEVRGDEDAEAEDSDNDLDPSAATDLDPQSPSDDLRSPMEDVQLPSTVASRRFSSKGDRATVACVVSPPLRATKDNAVATEASNGHETKPDVTSCAAEWTTIPSPIAIPTAALVTNSMTTVAMAPSNAATGERFEASDDSRVTADEMTSSAHMTENIESTSGGQKVNDLCPRFRVKWRQSSRQTKSVQTDAGSQTDDDVTSCHHLLPPPAGGGGGGGGDGQQLRPLRQLRLNALRLLCHVFPVFDVDRLEEVDSKFEKFVRDSIDSSSSSSSSSSQDIKTNKTADKTQRDIANTPSTETETEQRSFRRGHSSWKLDKRSAPQDDVITLSDSEDDVKPDVSSLSAKVPKEENPEAVENRWLMADDERISGPGAGAGTRSGAEGRVCQVKEKEQTSSVSGEPESISIEPEKSTWKTRLGSLCRPPLHSADDKVKAKVIARSKRSSVSDKEADDSTRKRDSAKFGQRIDDYFSSKKQRNE